jgi:radical SAM superfamily enzyme YgiQ (UPF0313 family)
MSTMKVLLISANRLNIPYPVYPLGIDLVADLISSAHEVKTLDLLAHKTGVKDTVQGFAPDVIGIGLRNVDNTDVTASQTFVADYRALVQELRSLSQVPVVLGGAGFSIFPEILLRELDADYGIVGEGERFLFLLEALEKNQDPAHLTGVICRGQTGPVPPAPLIESIVPRRNNCFKLDSYLSFGGMLNLQTKRGCSYECIYCTYPQIEGRRQRLIPAKQVGQEARRLQDCGAKFLFMTDATFNSNIQHNLDVAQALQDCGVSIPWSAFFSPLVVPKDYYQRLADSGCSHVEFGTESMSDKVLRAYKKPFRKKHVVTSHEQALKAGLFVAHYFLLGGPAEDLDTLSVTLGEVEKLTDTVLFFFCGMRIYPHTRLCQLACDEHQITSENDLLDPVFYQSPALAGVDMEAIVQQYAKGRISWIVGAGSEKIQRLMLHMYTKQHTGPLWEKLIR